MYRLVHSWLIRHH